MTKLVETEIPDWAEWMAQDRDGDWWVFATEPKPDIEGGYWRDVDDLSTQCGHSGKENPDWRTTLHKLEEKP